MVELTSIVTSTALDLSKDALSRNRLHPDSPREAVIASSVSEDRFVRSLSGKQPASLTLSRPLQRRSLSFLTRLEWNVSRKGLFWISLCRHLTPWFVGYRFIYLSHAQPEETPAICSFSFSSISDWCEMERVLTLVDSNHCERWRRGQPMHLAWFLDQANWSRPSGWAAIQQRRPCEA